MSLLTVGIFGGAACAMLLVNSESSLSQAKAQSIEDDRSSSDALDEDADAAGVAKVKSASAPIVFKDPAPPEVFSVNGEPIEKTKPYERVTFHAPAKPLSPTAVTEDWANFLGPQHTPISRETELLHEWPDEGPAIVWELNKSASYSSPSIVGERLVYTHRDGNDVFVDCLHPSTGELYWQYTYPTEYQDRYGYGGGPRASPVINGERVFLYGAEGELFCLHLLSGELIWERQLPKEFNVPQDFFGSVGTPLLIDGKLIINVGAPGGPCVAAFDAETGRMVWGAGNQWGPSYASPIPATVHGRSRVFVFAGGDSRPPVGGLLALDPANGDIDFEFPWRSKSYESVNASCPVIVDNSVFVTATYKTGSAFLQIDADMNYKTAWTTDEVGLHWNTPVVRDGYLYAFDGRNEPDASAVCVDLKTGEVVWREVATWNESIELGGRQQTVELSTMRGTLLYADGKFLCLGELGHLMWLDLTPEGYKEEQRTWLFAAKETWALPVLSHGLLYISQNSREIITKGGPRLICYDLRGEKSKVTDEK
ncbi:MAG: PQQ-like beta-propeller repeat protein [Planctomycetota bacterium]|nr:PQQ-like beta-propeller repeat protein [Planctomycetota bacterium]